MFIVNGNIWLCCVAVLLCVCNCCCWLHIEQCSVTSNAGSCNIVT
jgi:hypothetical protein